MPLLPAHAAPALLCPPLLLLLLLAAAPPAAEGLEWSVMNLKLEARDDASPGTVLVSLAGYVADALPVNFSFFPPPAFPPLDPTSPSYPYMMTSVEGASLAPFALSPAGVLTLTRPDLLYRSSSFNPVVVAMSADGRTKSLPVNIATSRALALSAATAVVQLAFGAVPRVGAPSLLRAGSGGSAGAPLATADANALALAQAVGGGRGAGGASFGDLDLAKAIVTTTAAFFSATECGLAVSGAPSVTTTLIDGAGSFGAAPTYTGAGVYSFIKLPAGVTFGVSFSTNTSIGFVLVGGGGGGSGGNLQGNSGGGGGGGGGVATAGRGVLTLLKNVVYSITIGAGGAGGLTGFSGSSGGNTSIVGPAGEVLAFAGGGGGGPVATGDGGSGWGAGGAGGISPYAPLNGATFQAGKAGGAGYGGPGAPGVNGASIAIPVNDGSSQLQYAGLLNGLANVGSGGGGGGSNAWGAGGSAAGGGSQGASTDEKSAEGSLGGGGGGYGDSRSGRVRIGGRGGDGFATIFFCQGSPPTMNGLALADLAAGKPPPSTAELSRGPELVMSSPGGVIEGGVTVPKQGFTRRAANQARRAQGTLPAPCLGGSTFGPLGAEPCTPCRVCSSLGAAVVTAVNCTASTDTICMDTSPCGLAIAAAVGTSNASTPCIPGCSFSGSGTFPCSRCKTCANGASPITPCLPNADAVCPQIYSPVPCNAGMNYGPLGFAPCKSCTVCSSLGAAFVTAANCTAASDTVCTDTSPCGLAIAAAAGTSNASTPCIPGCSFSGLGTFPCSRCKTCAGGASPITPCSSTSDTVCPAVSCVAGVSYNMRTGAEPCMPCGVCPFGAVQACTALSDAVCLATAWNASSSGYSPSGLLAARVQAFEGVALVADLFALNGALAAAGYPVVLQRAVPAGPAYAFMPDGLADSRPGQGGVRFSTGFGLSNASFSPKRVAAVAGLDIGIVQARWTLYGVPSALVEPVVFSSGAKDSASVSKLHHLSFTAASLSVVVPPGQLFPGYVYAVTCEIDLAVKLALDYSTLQAGALPAAALAAAAPANYKAINDLATARMIGSAAAYNVSSSPDVVLVSTRQMRNAFLYVHAPAAIASVAVAPAKSPPLWELNATSSAGAGDAAMWAPATNAPPLTAALAWALATLPLGPPSVLAVLGVTMQQMTAADAATALGSATPAASFVPGSYSIAAEALFAAALTGAPPFAGSQSAVAPGFVSALGVNVTAVNSTLLTAAAAKTSTLSPAAAAAALAAGPFATLAPTAVSAAAAQLQANKLVQALLSFPGVPPHAAPSTSFSFFADTTGAATLPSGAVPAASNAADPAAAALQQLALTNVSATDLPGWVALTAGGGGGGFILPAGRAPTYQVRVAALAIDLEGARAVAVAPSAALVCPLGMFALLDGSTCAVCPYGTFSAAAGLAATAASPQPCSGCGAGSFSDAGASTCLPCGAGSYSGARSSTCTSCPAGTASAVVGLASSKASAMPCASCPAGFFSPAPGASACLPCAAGSLSAAGATSCSPCPPGSWCSGLTVTPCAAGLDAPAGSTSAANCTACAQSFYCLGGGSVQCAVGTVSPAGSTSAANCTALSAASVSAAISSLGNVSTPAGAIGALATASTIASFLDSSSNATASNAMGANATAALAAATAARGAVIAQIWALVNVLAGGAGGGAAALVASANVTNSTSLNSTSFQALLADTSIPLSPNATTAVAQALSALTSSPTQLSAAAAGDALDALSSISLLSLPVNVLSGAVDLAGGVAAATANASAAGGNAIAPPPVPPLPAATASLFLTTIGNVAAAVSQTSNATAAAAVQVKVAAALGAVSAAVLRAAVAGDPPTSVRAGSASAFNASAGAGYCGDALSLTVARLSSNGSLALGLGAPIAPCGGAAGSAGAALPAPALSASPAFLAGAARGASALGITAGSVDVSFVQNGRSPVPESAGFAALGALGPPAPLDTRVVSVVLQTRAGGKIAVANSSTPLELTLPLASGSSASSAALAVQAAYRRPSVSVACAASPRPSLVLVDCGAPVGKRNVTCAASAKAFNGTYVCPSISVQPQCVFWNVASGAWSSAGCVALTSSFGSITCACNHTTEFAARFSALAAQQQEIFGRGEDLFVNSAENFRQFPHVAAILGTILGLTLLALAAAFALDREGFGRFYESLQADREVQFLARIENLKGGVFVLDRVLDHRVDAMQEKIAQARLESQARAIAEAEGMTFLQRGVDLPPDVSGAVSLRHVATDLNARRHGVFTSSVLKVLGRGGQGSRAARDSSASTEDGVISFAHANVLFNKKRGAEAAAGAITASVGVGAAKDAPAGPAAAAHPAPEGAAVRALSILSGDGFALAIYARLTRSFEQLSVSGGKNSRLEALWRSGAAGNSSDIAAAFGLPRRAAGVAAAEADEVAAAAPLSPSSRAIATLLRDEGGVDSLAAERAKRLEAEAEEAAAAAAAAAASKEHESAAHVLDSVGGWTCLRAWRLRGFLLRTWLLGVMYQHPVLGLFAKFEPRISRTLRVLVLASSLIADLWTTTFLYAFVVGGDSSKPLPDLTIPETIVVAVLSSLLQVPIGALIGILATRAGEAEFAYRFPFIDAELRRRKDTERRLSLLSKKALESELAVIAAERTLTAPSAGPAAAHKKEAEPPADFAHGWTDAPEALQRFCAPLLRCCGRHPDQRAAYIARAHADEEALVAKRAKRRERAAARKALRARVLTGMGLGDRQRHAGADAAAAPGTGAAADVLAASEVDDEAGEAGEEADFESSPGDNGDLMLATLACCIGAMGGRKMARSAAAAAAAAASAAASRSSRALGVPSLGEHTKTAVERAKASCGPCVRCCRRVPFTAATATALGVIWAFVAFCLWYIVAFGFLHPASVTLSYTIAWATSQATSLFLVAPLLALASTVVTFAVVPAWLPWLLWIPYVGRFVAGRAASAFVTDDGGSSLSGRLENLALVRAAGAASLLPGEAAVIAYGAGGVLSAAMAGVVELAAGRRGEAGSARGSEAFRALSAYQRRELIVDHYLLQQLRAAQNARTRTKSLATTLAFAAGRPKMAIVVDAAAKSAAAAAAAVAAAGSGAAEAKPAAAIKRFAVTARAASSLVVTPAPRATAGSPARVSVSTAEVLAELAEAPVAARAGQPAARASAAEARAERESELALEAAASLELAAADVPLPPSALAVPRSRVAFTAGGDAKREVSHATPRAAGAAAAGEASAAAAAAAGVLMVEDEEL